MGVFKEMELQKEIYLLQDRLTELELQNKDQTSIMEKMTEFYTVTNENLRLLINRIKYLEMQMNKISNLEKRLETLERQLKTEQQVINQFMADVTPAIKMAKAFMHIKY